MYIYTCVFVNKEEKTQQRRLAGWLAGCIVGFFKREGASLFLKKRKKLIIDMYMVWKWRGEGRGGDDALFLLDFFWGGGVSL